MWYSFTFRFDVLHGIYGGQVVFGNLVNQHGRQVYNIYVRRVVAERLRALGASSGPDFLELMKQKILPNSFLLSRNEQDTSHKLYT